MAGLINWKKATIPAANPDTDHNYIGIDSADSALYQKNSSGIVTKLATTDQLALKYDASNPNGYETPTQLNTRDTNNRNRANHTGTQLAATISNFVATVLSSVLTGISFAVSTPVVDTDSILIAMGKIQAQINILLASTGVFGAGFQDFLSLVPFTTASNSPVLAYSFVTSVKPVGRYRIAFKWAFTGNATNASQLFTFRVDGVIQGPTLVLELKDTSGNLSFDQIVYLDFASATTHTIELYAHTSGSNTVTISRALAEIWRVS